MKIYVDEDVDYVEVFFRQVKNYGVDIKKGVVQFRDEESDEVVGYAFENASKEIAKTEFLTEEVKEEIRRVLE